MTIALPGVIAVVTGAGGGIGRAVVKAMKDAGATVIATDMARDILYASPNTRVVSLVFFFLLFFFL